MIDATELQEALASLRGGETVTCRVGSKERVEAICAAALASGLNVVVIGCFDGLTYLLVPRSFEKRAGGGYSSRLSPGDFAEAQRALEHVAAGGLVDDAMRDTGSWMEHDVFIGWWRLNNHYEMGLISRQWEEGQPGYCLSRDTALSRQAWSALVVVDFETRQILALSATSDRMLLPRGGGQHPTR